MRLFDQLSTKQEGNMIARSVFRSNRLLFLGSWLLLSVSSVFGQGERGAITGTVTDQTGAIIPETEVTAIDAATNVKYSTTSTGSGTYRVPSLPPGIYKLVAIKSGFKQAVAENIRVAVGTTVNVDLRLQVGETTETITVQEESPLLQSVPQLGTDVSPQEFNTWPLFQADQQRQPQDFIFNSLPGSAGGSFQGSINGGQNFGYEILVDGIPLERNYLNGGSTDLTPSVESVSEFKLQTVNIGANYGGAGTAVVNFSIKSGTNEFHGTAYEFNSNSAFQSNGATTNFLRASDPSIKKGYYNQNNFGAAISGPIRKNKTFFFGTWEGTRSRNYGFGSPTTLPTLAWRSGDFSDQLGPQLGTDALGRPVYQGEIFDPATTRPVNGELVRDPFTYQGRLNVIDPARFSNVSKNIVPLIPQPQNGNTRNNYFLIGGYGLTARMDQLSVKVDHVFNEKHKASGYFNYGRKPIDIPYEGSFVERNNPTNRLHVETDQPRILRFSEDWTLSPTRLNHFGFGFNRINTGQRCLTFNQGWPEKLGLQGVEPTCFPLLSFESANGLDLKTLGDTNVPLPASGSWVVKDDFTQIHGRHTFQMGFEFRRYFYKDLGNASNTSGSFNFSILETQGPGFADTGHQFASFLLGAVDTANRNVYAGHPIFVANYPSLYFQDEMKLTPKLTVTVGIRWEIPRPRYEKHNFTSGFDPNEPNPGVDGRRGALVFLADTGRKSFQEAYYRELAPNLGIAYALNPKTVIRTGYAITYNPPIANAYGFDEAYGQQAAVDINRGAAPNAYAPVLYWDNGMPPFTGTLPSKDPTLQNGSNISWTLPSSLAQGYIQNWNLGVQRELLRQTTVEVNYVGTKGTRLPGGSYHLAALFNMTPSQYLALGDALYDDINAHPELRPYPSFEGTVNQALRPFPQYQGISLTGFNVGSSIYHAMQVQVRKRPVRGGLGFIMAYTFSKTLTDNDDALGGYYYNNQDFYNRKTERSVASFSHPHDLKLTWIWDLPVGKGRRFLNQGGILDKILGGWTLTAIQRYRSGNPLPSYDYNFDPGVIFTEVIRPDRVSGVTAYQKSSGYDLATGTTWINPQAFADPPHTTGGIPLRPGNAPRFIDVYGPWQPSETAAIHKNFLITERLGFEFRAEMNNVFNRTQRRDPVMDFSSPDFGRIIGVSGTRIIQFSGRIRF
jgi:Carboxypeptidase regulatory-like domain/TonB dependent receptor